MGNNYNLCGITASYVLVGLLGLSASRSFGAEAAHPFSISDVLRSEAFKPSFPTERELIKKYGPGVVERNDNELFHVYRDRKNDLWIGCRVEEEDRLYRPVTGIVLSRRPLSSIANIPGVKLRHTSLHGIRVGDRLSRVQQKLGEPLRSYLKPLGKESALLTYEFFPKSLPEGSCLRFYVRNSTIEAMSFSSEE